MELLISAAKYVADDEETTLPFFVQCKYLYDKLIFTL